MNGSEFNRNISAHTAEELAPYEGQFVAWSRDGKQILAHATEEEDLHREIDRLHLTKYVVGFIPSSDS
jgi:hypothetical protein